MQRHGTILIIVAGLSALLASLSIAFLTRMRSDVAESHMVMRDAQARIMLVAGLNYIQESGRIGWEHKLVGNVNTFGREAYGWVDVRDGLIGPKIISNKPEIDPTTPRVPTPEELPFVNLGESIRCPMYRWTRPPYAIQQTVSYNPIENDPTEPNFAMPYLNYPDPQPVVSNDWSPGGPATDVDNANFGLSTTPDATKFLYGDSTPVPITQSISWFRVYRKGPATFIITCGAGGTGGHRSWDRMTGIEQDEFGGPTGQTLWASLRAEEVIMWFEAEWSPAVGGATYQCIDNEQSPDHYQWRPFNTTHESQSQPHARNFCGTFRYIQRLRYEPKDW
jgi:hypothetical protein